MATVAQKLQLQSLQNLSQGPFDPFLDRLESDQADERDFERSLTKNRIINEQSQNNAIALEGIRNDALIDRETRQREFSIEDEDRELLEKVQTIPGFQLPPVDLTPGKLPSGLRASFKQALAENAIKLEGEKFERGTERAVARAGAIGEAQRGVDLTSRGAEAGIFRNPEESDPQFTQRISDAERLQGRTLDVEAGDREGFEALLARNPASRALFGKVDRADPQSVQEALTRAPEVGQQLVDTETQRLQNAIDSILKQEVKTKQKRDLLFAQIQQSLREETLDVDGLAPDPAKVAEIVAARADEFKLNPTIAGLLQAEVVRSSEKINQLRQDFGATPSQAIQPGGTRVPFDVSNAKDIAGNFDTPDQVARFARSNNLTPEETQLLMDEFNSANQLDFTLTPEQQEAVKLQSIIEDPTGAGLRDDAGQPQFPPLTQFNDNPDVGILDRASNVLPEFLGGRSELEQTTAQNEFRARTMPTIQRLKTVAEQGVEASKSLPLEARQASLLRLKNSIIDELRGSDLVSIPFLPDPIESLGASVAEIAGESGLAGPINSKHATTPEAKTLLVGLDMLIEQALQSDSGTAIIGSENQGAINEQNFR